MSNVKIQGSPTGTGNVTLAAPVTSSDITITLPSADGALISVAPGPSGNVLTSNGTAWTSAPGGGGGGGISSARVYGLITIFGA